MEEKRKLLEEFLKYIIDNCCDEYGMLQVMKIEDEKERKKYYSESVEGVVDTYLTKN